MDLPQKGPVAPAPVCTPFPLRLWGVGDPAQELTRVDSPRNRCAFSRDFLGFSGTASSGRVGRVSRPPVAFLVGFMGSGKTTVGRALAARLGLSFVDLDERIARHAGKSVRDIFDQEGEDAFRARERAALVALEPELHDGAVIATGGGACTDAAARAFMQAHGTMVWLDVPLETIERRVPRDGSRPLFGDRATLDALYRERRGGYATAGLRVEVDALPPEDVAALIAGKLGD